MNQWVNQYPDGDCIDFVSGLSITTSSCDTKEVGLGTSICGRLRQSTRACHLSTLMGVHNPGALKLAMQTRFLFGQAGCKEIKKPNPQIGVRMPVWKKSDWTKAAGTKTLMRIMCPLNGQFWWQWFYSLYQQGFRWQWWWWVGRVHSGFQWDRVRQELWVLWCPDTVFCSLRFSIFTLFWPPKAPSCFPLISCHQKPSTAPIYPFPLP